MIAPSIFKPITITWEDEEYTIAPDKVFGAIYVVEQHLTLAEIHNMYQNRAAFRMTQLASAYCALLTYAGVQNLTPELVYVGMFGDAGAQSQVMQSILILLNLMIPPKKLAAPSSGEAG